MKGNKRLSGLPPAFVAQIASERADGASLLRALDEPPVASVRLNTGKPIGRDALALGDPVAWCPSGRYLDGRPDFAALPEWHAGALYAQEASSMFLSHVLRSIALPGEPRCLDLCAAPGGKSTLLLDHLAGRGLLICNEPVRERARVLDENMAKWGAGNALVCATSAARLATMAPGFFDLILVDAPCSGEGMMRKDDEARRQWTPALRRQCETLQRAILTDILPALRPGGTLVYSTCTFNPGEDERQVRRLSEERGLEPIEVATPDEWGVTHPAPGCHSLLPHRLRGEGLFMAALRKEGDRPRNPPATPINKEWRRRRDVPPPLPGREAWQRGEAITLLPEGVAGELLRLASALPALSVGTPAYRALDTRRGELLEPTARLALAQAFTPANEAPVDRLTALRYLHGETALGLDGQGYRCLTYRGQPLGFAKVTAGRANNLYPKEWRLRRAPDTL